MDLTSEKKSSRLSLPYFLGAVSVKRQPLYHNESFDVGNGDSTGCAPNKREQMESDEARTLKSGSYQFPVGCLSVRMEKAPASIDLL